MTENTELDLDKFEKQATDREQWYSGGGYLYVELLPEELGALIAEVRRLRAELWQCREFIRVETGHKPTIEHLDEVLGWGVPRG